MNLKITVAAVLMTAALSIPAAVACGFGEAPSGCGQTDESDARYMLLRVISAVKADEPKALRQFTRGENGFRTQDTYVFCVGSDGVMSAHPSPSLQGRDVRDLHDPTGNYFIATMMKTAKPGEVSEIHYLFPRPGGSVSIPKTTYYTRASSQVCGVGVYDADENTTPEPTPSSKTRQERLAELRARLGTGMPSNLNADWTAFLQALDEESKSERDVIAKVRELIATN